MTSRRLNVVSTLILRRVSVWNASYKSLDMFEFKGNTKPVNLGAFPVARKKKRRHSISRKWRTFPANVMSSFSSRLFCIQWWPVNAEFGIPLIAFFRTWPTHNVTTRRYVAVFPFWGPLSTGILIPKVRRHINLTFGASKAAVEPMWEHALTISC